MTYRNTSTAMKYLLLASMFALALPAAGQDKNAAGKAVFDKSCALCHVPGIAGAPKVGDAAAWAGRVREGIATLYRSALQGTSKGMPAKGGNLGLAEADVKAAVDYMVAAAGGASRAPSAAAPADKRPAVALQPPSVLAVAPVPGRPAAAPVVATEAPAAVATAAGGSHDPNSFNRLLAPPSARNLPPPADGIHDPDNAGTHSLQPPLVSFERLPRSAAGNRVDWVAALGKEGIRPRWDIADPKGMPMVMDLNIVREVKGSMPDVVYPHKQHTEWLDCSNCHPSIFIPQKGANQISMASILLGKQCGVCHGKVAFPVSECRLCHSKKKDMPVRASHAAAATEVKQ